MIKRLRSAGRIQEIQCRAFPLLFVSVAAVGVGLGMVSSGAGAASLTLYSAQHEQTVDILTKAFTKETGIDVKVHSGRSSGARQPTGEGGKVVAGRRFLHRELARARIAVGEGAAGESRAGDAGQRAGPGQRVRRRLGRRSRPRKRAGLQHRHDPGGGAARLPARSGEAGVEGQDRHRADRRRFPAAGRGGRGDEGASRRARMAQRPARQRHDLRRRRRGRRRGRPRRGRGRDHQQLLLGAAQHGKRR